MNTNSLPPVEGEPPAYHSYLLRLWLSAGGWRVSLDDNRTGRRLGFASLEMLFAFLIAATEAAGPGDSPPVVGAE